MKTLGKKQFKYNSKVTTSQCIRCGRKFEAHRNDSKTCSDLCRVQEGIERKEKGYIHLVLKGNKTDMDAFLRKLTDINGVFFFSKISDDIRTAIQMNDNSKNWKLESKDLRLTFFPNNKKKPFELYFVTIIKVKFDLYYGPKPNFINPKNLPPPSTKKF